MGLTPEQHTKALVATLATFIDMSDHAEEKGGAGSIAGVAALHRMQSSIQKNRKRLLKLLNGESPSR